MKNTFVLLICLALFAMCKRYPEGGFHYNYLKHLDGQWSLKLYEVDGIDSTNLIPQSNSSSGLNNFASFAIAHSGKRAEILLTSYPYGYPVLINNQNRDVLQIYNGNVKNLFKQRNIFAPTMNEYFDWKIEKLKSKELVLSSNNYKLILIKK